MKRLLLIIPLSFSLALPACKKVKGPVNGNSVQQNNNLDSTISMSATINGRFWQSDSVFSYAVKSSGNDSGVINLQITATKNFNDTPNTIIFYIINYTGPQTYIINPPVNSATYYVGSMRHLARVGQIRITSDTAYALRGTFNFVADTFEVANGTFDVALP